MKRLALALACVAAAGLTGCQEESYRLIRRTPENYQTVPRVDLTQANYKAVDQLISQVRSTLPTDAPIVVSTVVNINALESTTPFGRVVSEHVLGRLAQAGFGVLELKVRQSVYLRRNEGEFVLTREIRELARSHNAHALIVGTYAEAYDRVFVSLKAVEADGNRVIGAVDYAILKDDVVRSLLSIKTN